MSSTQFKIGDFSRLCRVPVSALRYYADIGLLEPAAVADDTGYRYYTLDQLPRLNRILALRDLGFSLDQIGRLLADDVSVEQLQGMLILKQAEIEQTIETEQARLRQVAARLALIAEESERPSRDVVLKAVDPLPVLSLRAVVSESEDVGALLMESAMALMGTGTQPAGPPLTLFHDPEFAEHDLDVEVALPVANGASQVVTVDAYGQLEPRTLPAATMACAVHMGDYATLESTYAAIGRWLALNDYALDGPARELYLQPHMDETEGITEVQFPVRPKAAAAP